MSKFLDSEILNYTIKNLVSQIDKTFLKKKVLFNVTPAYYRLFDSTTDNPSDKLTVIANGLTPTTGQVTSDTVRFITKNPTVYAVGAEVVFVEEVMTPKFDNVIGLTEQELDDIKALTPTDRADKYFSNILFVVDDTKLVFYDKVLDSFTDCTSGEKVLPQWETDHDYIVGDRVKHNNYVYECIIEHHSDLVEFDNDKDNWIIELDKYFSLSQNQYDQMVTDGLIDDTNKHLYIIEDSEEESKLPEDEEPYTITADNGTTRLFACGYPMLIDSNTNHQYDSTASEDSVVFLYKFEAEPKMIVMDKTQASNTTVFGGYGDKNIGVTRVLPQTSLVAKNVALRGIVGGSFFQGIIGKAEIEIENCEIKNIVGGGWAGESVEGLNAEKNIVTEANVKVTNTTGIQLLFGGSQGFGVVDKVNIEVNGASEIHWLTTGGSNGYTRQGTVTINGGQIKVVQGVNRGIVDESNIILNNGTVENFYVGGEIGDATVTGKIFKGHVELNFGTIDNFYRGNSELVEFANVEGTIMDTIVTNGDISMLRKIINTEGKADYELSFTDQKDINLQHNLKCKYPMIRVFDTNDNELYMDIEYYSDNLTILHSEIEISGKVIVNKL